MNKPITGSGPHAAALCKALGVDPKRCASIKFEMVAGKVAIVTVERHVYDHEAEQFSMLMERYKLVPADEVPQDDRTIADAAVRKAITAP